MLTKAMILHCWNKPVPLQGSPMKQALAGYSVEYFFIKPVIFSHKGNLADNANDRVRIVCVCVRERERTLKRAREIESIIEKEKVSE